MSSEEESTGPVIRDRRRIDPATGKVREPAQSGSPRGAGAPLRGGPGQARPGKHAASKPGGISGAVPGGHDQADSQASPPGSPASPGLPGDGQAADGQAAAQERLAERTADLQRLQAEYANYRKRVERDREAVVIGAKASVVNDLLPLLDDLERAEQHGDLTGAFKAVGEKLVSGLLRAGLESFGVEGEPFDPSVHEAVQHNTSPDVPGPTVTVVMRRGYRFGERVLRAALVGVTDHEPA